MAADVVINQHAPMMARQVIDGMPHYAVVFNRDNLKLLCVGCFKAGMIAAAGLALVLLNIGQQRMACATGDADQQSQPSRRWLTLVPRICWTSELGSTNNDISTWTTDDLVME